MPYRPLDELDDVWTTREQLLSSPQKHLVTIVGLIAHYSYSVKQVPKGFLGYYSLLLEVLLVVSLYQLKNFINLKIISNSDLYSNKSFYQQVQLKEIFFLKNTFDVFSHRRLFLLDSLLFWWSAPVTPLAWPMPETTWCWVVIALIWRNGSVTFLLR